MKLYEMAVKLRDLLDNEELTDEQVAEIEKLELSFDEKINGVCTALSEAGADEHLVQCEIGRLTLRRDRAASKQKALKGYLKFCLDQAGLKKHKTNIWTVRVQNSPPSCLAVAVEELPAEYVIRKEVFVQDNKKAIEHWKNTGESPQGFRIIVGQHVRVE